MNRGWTVATETGYRIPTIPLKPRFSAKADISSIARSIEEPQSHMDELLAFHRN
jgi:hypothetical protein